MEIVYTKQVKLSIEKLLTIKDLNENAINNQIMNIYATQIITANNENNYDLVLNYYPCPPIIKFSSLVSAGLVPFIPAK